MDLHPWLSVVIAVCVVVSGCGSDDSPSLSGATTSTHQDTAVSTVVESVPTAATPAIPLLTNTRWVRMDFEALVGERDQAIVEVDELALGSTVVKRGLDGTVVYAALGGLFQIEPGAVEPTRLFDGEIFDLARNENGEVLASTALGTFHPASGEFVDTQVVPGAVTTIVAANGMAVESVPGSFRLDDGGWIAHVERPDGIRLLNGNGEQIAIWELGGSAAPFVSLVDFDGRFIVASRGPEEPALPPWDHFVIDLQTGSVDGFTALPGTVALATVDDLAPPSVVQIPSIDVCSTWSSVLAKEPDQNLPDAVADGFHDAALAIARCDTWFTSRRVGPSIGPVIEWDDAAGWNALQRSLLGPSTVNEGSWSWESDPAATITIDVQGSVKLVMNIEG